MAIVDLGRGRAPMPPMSPMSPTPAPGPVPPAGPMTPTPASPYTNRIVTLGRVAMPAPGAPVANAPTAPVTPQTFARTLATSAVPGANGAFSFRRPTGPVSAAATNHRTVGFRSGTPQPQSMSRQFTRTQPSMGMS